MSGFSFKLTKSLEKKVLQDSKLRDEATKDRIEDPDYIKDVSDSKIIGTKKDTTAPLVIPLIAKNNWREGDSVLKEKVGNKKKSHSANGGQEKEESAMTIEERAAKELVEESRKQLQEWEERHNGPQVDEVPLLLSNAVPKGFETDENLDVSLRAEQSTLDDYESIPVEQFGMAVLRGMGWRPDVGIGGFKSQVVKTVEPVVRPKGLGLGASKPKKEEAQVVKEGEEKLVLKRGAFILIESGRKAGLYGEVEGFDEENARLMVKLALGGERVSVSENIVQLVTVKEYKEWGKIVNKDKYEKFKKEKEEKDEKERRREEERRRSRSRSAEKKNGRREEKRSRNRSDSDASCTPSKRSKSVQTWVRPALRVRCIDKKYKGGKYFNVKINVVDVVENERCVCLTDDRKHLEGVRTDQLETVIPREDRGRVMVVQGSSMGEVAEILKRNKSRYEATIRLISSDELIVKNYEDICEYRGYVEEYD